MPHDDAIPPAFFAVGLLIVSVHEPASALPARGPGKRLKLADVKRLDRRYWFVVGLGAVFTLARFSEAFLILRAQDLGMAIVHLPVIMIVMNIGYSLFAYPAGAAADRFAVQTLLPFGLALLVFADLVLAIAQSPRTALVGAAFWGLHMAFSQGLLSKMVADRAPADLRGTAFGVFNLVIGVAILLASVIAGALWTALGAMATFGAGAAFALVAVAGLLFCGPHGGECHHTGPERPKRS